MNSSRYQQLSLRTVPEQLAYWVDGFEGDRDEARQQLMCNCALGLAGEAAEIEETPTSDEIGDGYWYASVLFWVLDVTDFDPVAGSAEDAVRAAHRSAGAVCELVKKHVFHARELADVREPLSKYAQSYVNALASLDGQPAPETFTQNVAKLEARYPAGFFERG